MNVSAAPAAAAAQAANVQAQTGKSAAAGENFGEQLLQLLLSGDAPAESAEAGEAPKCAEKASDAASGDDEVATPLLPGLSLLIQQMTNLDTQADASVEALNASSAIGSGEAGGLMDLLEQLAASTSANDDSTHSTLDTAALNPLSQPQQAMPAPTADANVAPTLSTPVNAAHAERFVESLDEQITWLADAARKDGPQQATISLHPAEWGSLQIRVDLAQDGRTTVKFDCETPQARQAIEASLTQLRELLSTTVVTGAAPRFELSGGFGHPQSGNWKPTPQTTNAIDVNEPVETPSIVRRSLGLLDQFA